MMSRLKQLIDQWEHSARERRTPHHYSVRLPVHDAAKLAALAEMYPGRTEQDLLTDLVSTALDEIEEALPYVPGNRVVAEDEQGDPIFEDVGPSPRFHALERKYLQRLKHDDEE